MYKTIKLSVPGFLVIGLLITGCSQQPANLAVADIQPIAMVKPTAIDAQVQDVIMPKPPKVYHKPVQRMAKPVQRMAKPIQRQRMVKPVQKYKMKSSGQHRMIKPTQRQSAY